MSPRPETDAAVAIGQIAFSLLHELGRARRRVVRGGDDPEALHDYRVALRRIRTVTRGLRPFVLPEAAPRLERVLRRIARGTGPARDHEVLAAWVRETAEHVPPRLAAVFDLELDRQGKRAAEVLAKVMRTRVHAEVVDLFDSIFRNPETLLSGGQHAFGEIARESTRPLVATARSDAEALLEAPGMAPLHQLRISLKRVRYALEAFAGGWPPGVLRLRATLKRMQDELGAVHDADLHAQWVVRAVVRAERRRMRARQRGLEILEIPDLRVALGALGPEGAVIEDADGLLATLEVQREAAAKSAMRLHQRSGLPGLVRLAAALEPPRPPAVRRVTPPVTPPVAANGD